MRRSAGCLSEASSCASTGNRFVADSKRKPAAFLFVTFFFWTPKRKSNNHPECGRADPAPTTKSIRRNEKLVAPKYRNDITIQSVPDKIPKGEWTRNVGAGSARPKTIGDRKTTKEKRPNPALVLRRKSGEPNSGEKKRRLFERSEFLRFHRKPVCSRLKTEAGGFSFCYLFLLDAHKKK